MEKEVVCCQPLKDAAECDGINNEGEGWYIAWDSAYTGYESIPVKFCPYCGALLP